MTAQRAWPAGAGAIPLLAGLVAGLAAGCRPEPPPPEGAWIADTVTTVEQPRPESPTAPRFEPGVPGFEDYFVADTTFEGPPVAVNVASAPYGRQFSTVLQQGAAAGPNFAGHFTVVEWGCGSGCQIVAVVDAVTGALSPQTLMTARGVSFRRDSGLLVADPQDAANPDPPDCAACGQTAYYVWQDGRLHPVGPPPHPHLDGPRPWAAGASGRQQADLGIADAAG